MKSFDELERLWTERPAPARARGVVKLIVARGEDGAHSELERGVLSSEHGLEGDRWARGKRDPDAQITLLNATGDHCEILVDDSVNAEVRRKVDARVLKRLKFQPREDLEHHWGY